MSRLREFSDKGKETGWVIIRVAVALLMGIHGIARISLGIVDDFGIFLGETGFPLGGVIAWGITLFEIGGAVALMLRWWVIPVAALFIFELMLGIVLVHAPAGWFVVGAGRNGVEYSFLLVACLGAIIISEHHSRKKTNG